MSHGKHMSKLTLRLKKLAVIIGAIGALSLPLTASAARTDALWDYIQGGNYTQPNGAPSGTNILIYGLNKYLNFGTITSMAGYGFRDNAGVMEVKSSGGSWQPIGTGSGSGTVTSVDVSGGTTGLTTSGGPVTGSGSITISGTLNVANGGTGANTLSGILKGNGTSPVSTAAAGTDYQAPITLTTTGSAGAATFVGNTLNVPQYAGTTYTGTYPVQVSGSIISLAFGTTTANSWSALQQFNAGATTTALTVSSGNLWLTGIADGCAQFAGGKFTSTGVACGTGSGGITSLNGLTNASQTFATSTATGIGLSIVSSGTTHTFTPTVSAGYSIPLTASTTDWNTAYLNRITSLTTTGSGAATLVANVLNIPTPAATAPAGASSTVQFNANGVFAGNSGMTYNGSTFALLKKVLIGPTPGSPGVNADTGLVVQGDNSNGNILTMNQAGTKGITIDNSGTYPTIHSDYFSGSDPELHLSTYTDKTNGNGLFILNGGAVGVGSTTPGATFGVGGNEIIGGNSTITGTATIGTLSGILKGSTGLVSAAANGTDYTLITAKTCTAGDFVSSVTAAGVFTCTTPAGTTYTGTYPIQVTGSVISLAFGTSTSNTWGGTQTFTNAPILGSLTGVIYGNNGTLASAATSTLTLGAEFSNTGTLGTEIGGTSGTLSLATNGVALTKIAQIAANSLLGNSTGATGNITAISTSTLNIGGTAGNVTGTVAVANGGTGQTSFTSGNLLYGNGTGALQNVATSSATCTSASGITCSTHSVVGSVAPTFALSAIPNTSLANSTISGVALGSTLNSHSVSADFTGTAYNGSAAVSDWLLKMSQPHSWTGLQQFTNASSTLFSNTGTAYFGATATTTISSIGSITTPANSILTLGTTTAGTLNVSSAGVVYAATGGGGITGSGASPQIPYFTGASAVAGDSNFTWTVGTHRLGIGATTTPFAPLSILAASSTGAFNAIVDVAGLQNTTSYDYFVVDQYGHKYTGGPTPATSAGSITGDDTNGTVTGGSTYTVTFAHPYKSTPVCTGMASGSGNSVAITGSPSASAVTFQLNGSGTLWYHCEAHQ